MFLFNSATFEIDDEKAAIFGAGCWAQDRTGKTDGMACSISGTGEEIIRANLGRSIGATYRSCAEPHQVLQRALMEYLRSEPSRNEEPEKKVGMEGLGAGVLMITRECALGGIVQNDVAVSD